MQQGRRARSLVVWRRARRAPGVGPHCARLAARRSDPLCASRSLQQFGCPPRAVAGLRRGGGAAESAARRGGDDGEARTDVDPPCTLERGAVGRQLAALHKDREKHVHILCEEVEDGRGEAARGREAVVVERRQDLIHPQRDRIVGHRGG
eukprot:5737211-Prymnesium_polylepis.2